MHQASGHNFIKTNTTKHKGTTTLLFISVINKMTILVIVSIVLWGDTITTISLIMKTFHWDLKSACGQTWCWRGSWRFYIWLADSWMIERSCLAWASETSKPIPQWHTSFSTAMTPCEHTGTIFIQTKMTKSNRRRKGFISSHGLHHEEKSGHKQQEGTQRKELQQRLWRDASDLITHRGSLILFFHTT